MVSFSTQERISQSVTYCRAEMRNVKLLGSVYLWMISVLHALFFIHHGVCRVLGWVIYVHRVRGGKIDI